MFKIIHKVKPGETLSQISLDYRKSLSEIIQANPLINPNSIYPGQLILFPAFHPQVLFHHIDVSVNNRMIKLFKDQVLQKHYSIAVGRMLHDTPTGEPAFQQFNESHGRVAPSQGSMRDFKDIRYVITPDYGPCACFEDSSSFIESKFG